MPASARDIAAVRAFNRDHTRRIGVLQESLLDSPYSLTEARVLYEIASRRGVTAAELADNLGVDRGYLSRILKRFNSSRLVTHEASASDARLRHLRLTPAGQHCFADLNRQSEQQITRMLDELDEPRLHSVVAAMQAIQSAFSPRPASSPGPGPTPASSSASMQGVARGEVTLRSHKPGDMGWVIERHGALYFEEYGWDERFEALVAQIASDFVTKLQPAQERCWIAEREGHRLGCIFLVSETERSAKLRLLLVDPRARGLGLGRRLITECVRFARSAGYRQIVLWTQQNLTAARHLYEQAGFIRTAEEPHNSFGHDLIGETWELQL
jgi:DNA-binding MarR family transcriptional regulator/GNAT superfamily N-acetyltransferase